jgi:hypothetical protein
MSKQINQYKMKTFKNQQTSITIGVEGTKEVKKMTYADLASLTLNIPPHEGWTKDEMKIRIKIESKLEKLDVDESVELEDAEFAKVLEGSNQPWQFKHKDLIAYMDDLEAWNKEE